jgi:hypothetical protein
MLPSNVAAFSPPSRQLAVPYVDFPPSTLVGDFCNQVHSMDAVFRCEPSVHVKSGTSALLSPRQLTRPARENTFIKIRQVIAALLRGC